MLFIGLECAGQTGYLGKKNNLQIESSISFSSKNVYSLSDDKSTVTSRPQFAYLKYSFNYSRTISKKSVIGFGYTRSTVNTIHGREPIITEDSIFVAGDFYNVVDKKMVPLESKSFAMNQFIFSYKFFRLGSRAPIGKFIGVDLIYGSSIVPDGEIFYLGGRSAPISRSAFKLVENVILIDSFKTEQIGFQFFQLRTEIGRVYPVADFLSINISLKLPVYSIFKINDLWEFPIPIVTDVIHFLDGYRLEQDSSQKPDLKPLFVPAAYRHTRMAFSVGLNFHF